MSYKIICTLKTKIKIKLMKSISIHLLYYLAVRVYVYSKNCSAMTCDNRQCQIPYVQDTLLHTFYQVP